MAPFFGVGGPYAVSGRMSTADRVAQVLRPAKNEAIKMTPPSIPSKAKVVSSLATVSKRSEATRGSCSKMGMLRLRRSSASLHSGSAQHDSDSGDTKAKAGAGGICAVSKLLGV